MTLIAVAASIALLTGDPLTRRIEDARSAAQALQGSLDGGWTLRETGRPQVVRIAVTDPPGSRAPARGAWLDEVGQTGAVEIATMGTRRLHLTLTGARAVEVELHRDAGSVWRGASGSRRFVLILIAAPSAAP